MSLFGAMSTAITGLTAQSAAFGNISDNVANSQTVGYKRVDTDFTDYLSTSTATQNDPGMVTARPSYVNTVQGTLSQTDNPLAMAISGQGFFPVSEATSVDSNGAPTFSPQAYFTRAGDFTLNQSGYIVNGAGNYLNGWSYDATSGQFDTTKLQPVQVSQMVYEPVPTSSITLSANLPSGVTTGSFNSEVSVYDSLGSSHQVDLTWTPSTAAASGATVPTGGAVWQITATSPDDPATATASTTPSAYVVFNADGTVNSISGPTPAASGTADYAQDDTAAVTATNPNPAVTLGVGLTFAGNLQKVDINLGNMNQATGMTQYGAVNNDYSLRSITQNGVAPGSFSSISTDTSGDIVVNYDNGQSRTLARVPVVTFTSPDSLQRQNGSAFTATSASGNPVAQDPATNGAGSIVTDSVEESNVDIATEFSQLIVAQQAYSANAKVVTTANTLLQTTIDMLR